MDEKFSTLLGRLEKVTMRLESMEVSGSSAASFASAGSRSPGPTASSGGGGTSPSVAAFDAYLAAYAQPFAAAAAKVGPDVQKQAVHVLTALEAQRRFLVCAAVCTKPTAEELPMLLADTSKAIGETQAAVDRRAADFNSLNAVGEGIAALSWVVVEPLPVPHIEEMKNASDFYATKVLMQYKNEPGEGAAARMACMNAWKALLTQLAAYVKEYHRTGVSWTPKGIPVSQYTTGSGATAGKKGGGPPPPPPPPPPPAADSGGGSGALAGGMAAVFGQLNAGASVTSGLRHVKKGDVTTPAAGVVALKPAARASGGGIGGGGAAPGGAASKPSRCALEGKKWMVEHYKNEALVNMDKAKLSESVYVYKCEGTTVQVSGKVNNLTLDSCKKTCLVFESAMAGIELVNCQGCKVQVTGTVATISVDKCDGTQLILSRAALDADIISAKSSELNIIVPGATDDAEYKEHAIPEQFISKYVGGRFVTKTVEHTA